MIVAFARSAPLAGSNGVAHDVVYRKRDELRALIEPALRLGAHLTEAPLDILDLQEAQLILVIKVCGDHLLDLTPDGLALRVRGSAVGTLQRAGHVL